MNKKALTLATASALALPLTVQADIKFSGAIQAEVGGVEQSMLSGGSGSRDTVTDDAGGSIGLSGGGGKNKLQFDIDEELVGGLVAFARISWRFDTFGGSNSEDGGDSFVDKDSYLGIRNKHAHIRFGRFGGRYKQVSKKYDPFTNTALQARGRNGGMSGNGGSGRNFGHNSRLDNAIEIGAKWNNISLNVQSILDDEDGNKGAILFDLSYKTGPWEVYIAGTDSDNKDTFSPDESADANNFKIGGRYNNKTLAVTVQYEDVEIGGMDRGGDKPGSGEGSYFFVAADYRFANNVSLAAWVGSYSAEASDEDAFSYAIGGRYHFSKRTYFYAGWRDTDSDNNMRDENVFVGGLTHAF